MKKFQSMIIRNERPFRALTGVPQKAFDTLLPEFTQRFNRLDSKTTQNIGHSVKEDRAAAVKERYPHLNSSSFLSSST